MMASIEAVNVPLSCRLPRSFLPTVNDGYIAEAKRLLPLPQRKGLLLGLDVLFLDEAQVCGTSGTHECYSSHGRPPRG